MKLITAAILLDLEKAFDKTTHNGIIQVFKNKGLDASMLKWIKTFLSDRSFYVFYNKQELTYHQITSGVPQGSCLSPTFFITYFSEVIKGINPHIKTELFADNLCIWATEKTVKKLEWLL